MSDRCGYCSDERHEEGTAECPSLAAGTEPVICGADHLVAQQSCQFGVTQPLPYPLCHLSAKSVQHSLRLQALTHALPRVEAQHVEVAEWCLPIVSRPHEELGVCNNPGVQCSRLRNLPRVMRVSAR